MFKKEKPASWEHFGPGTKIIALLYFHEDRDGLAKDK